MLIARIIHSLVYWFPAITALCGISHYTYKRVTRRGPTLKIMSVMGVMFGNAVVSAILKYLIRQPRPDSSGEYGMPSAHSMFASGLVVTLWLHSSSRSAFLPLLTSFVDTPMKKAQAASRARQKAYDLPAITFVAVVVGVSRVQTNAHMLSQVLWGYAGGVAYSLFAYWFLCIIKFWPVFFFDAVAVAIFDFLSCYRFA